MKGSMPRVPREKSGGQYCKHNNPIGSCSECDKERGEEVKHKTENPTLEELFKEIGDSFGGRKK